MKAMDKIKIADAINETLNGRVWCPNSDIETSPVRIYCAKGYIVIADDGHANIDDVGGHSFDAAKAACAKAGIEAKRW